MTIDEYHEIGRGGCGSVWALPTSSHKPPHTLLHTFPTPHVLKRGDGDPARSITNDMTMHRRFLNSTQSIRLPFLIPIHTRCCKRTTQIIPPTSPQTEESHARRISKSVFPLCRSASAPH